MPNGKIMASDLIDEQGIEQSLQNVQKNLDGLKSAIQDTASKMKITLGGSDSSSVSNLTNAISALADAMQKTKSASEVNKEALKAVTNEIKEQIKAEESLHNAKSKTERQREKATRQEEAEENVKKLLNQEIEIERLSYNQLSAMYSKMSADLKNMSKAKINATDASRKLAAATLNVRNAMNEAQKAMGNYSLNVGKYHTAFDGLGYSIQQVLREVPSAINIQQFFLAISNNIPMVVDQMKLFNDEQKNIRAQLADMKEGTKEYMELQERQMSMGTKLMKSIFNWQTAIIAILLLLRKYGAQIIDTFKSLFTKSNDYLSRTSQVYGVLSKSMGEFINSTTRLNLITSELDKVTRGSEEWKSIVSEISDITGQEIDKLNTTKQKVIEITKEWKKQQKERIIANAVEDLYSKNLSNQAKRSAASKATNYEQLAGIMGWEGDDYTKYKDMYEKAGGKKFLQQFALWMFPNSSRNIVAASEYANANSLKNEIYGQTPIMSEKDMNAVVKDLWKYMPKETNGSGNGDKNKTKSDEATYKEIENRYWEFRQSMIDIMEEGEQKEIAQENLNNEKLLAENENAWSEQKLANAENRKNELISEEEFHRNQENNQLHHNTIQENLNTEHTNNLQAIDDKYRKAEIDAELTQISKIGKLELKQYTRRIRTKDDEMAKNKAINANIAILEDKIIKLQSKNTGKFTDLEQKKQDYINETINAINNQRKSLSWTKQLANNKDLGDVLGGTSMLEGLAGGDKGGFLAALGLDMTGASSDQIDSAFEEWMQNASDAIVKWKDVTVDNLSEMLDAYVEFYQAKADAAAEDTDTAKEYYDSQKSLLDQGYANSVNTAWKEYQEKLRIQKKAEKDAERAEEVQKLADEAQNMSNLIVATTNILKQYSANPILAGALITTMWGTYAAAKIMAVSASKYEQGGYEELTGGSHASGHDINLGVVNGKNRTMIAEGGESIAVFSRKAKRKYGDTIGEIVKSINDGTYERDSMDRLNENARIMVRPYRANVNLTKIEHTLDSIDRNGKNNSYLDANGNMVVVNGNSKTTYIR